MPVHEHLREERTPRVAEEDQRQIGVGLADDLGEGPHRVAGGAEPAGSEAAELAVVAVPLPEAGAAVTAVVVGVDGVAVGDEGVDQRAVAPGVFAHPVQQLDDGPRGLRLVDVVHDGDAVGVGELGHAQSLGARSRRKTIERTVSKTNELC